jgi:hypothetical protein
MSEDGAVRLAGTIRAYWLHRGHLIRVEVIDDCEREIGALKPSRRLAYKCPRSAK